MLTDWIIVGLELDFCGSISYLFPLLGWRLSSLSLELVLDLTTLGLGDTSSGLGLSLL